MGEEEWKKSRVCKKPGGRNKSKLFLKKVKVQNKVGQAMKD